MKPYQVEGDFTMGRIRQPFVLQVAARDEAAARERVLATIGSRHGVTRREIAITSVKTIPPDDVTDAAARVELRRAKA
jgi:large subunit ribosomal protein LX